MKLSNERVLWHVGKTKSWNLRFKLQIEKENTISLETISQVQLKVYETTVFVYILYFIFNIYRRSVRAKKVGKGAWWMPRLLQAKKDVISCDKPREGANDHWSADFRMGQPGRLKDGHQRNAEANPGNWNILVPGGRENKLVIPLVVASERGIAQTSEVPASLGL